MTSTHGCRILATVLFQRIRETIGQDFAGASLKNQGEIFVDGGTGGAAPRPREERRRIGAFYTPAPLSAMLADWAIRSPNDTVLEPSFGGCGFLAAAHDRLSYLGSVAPQNLIYGCDVDPVAFRHLSDDLPGWEAGARLVLRDFLKCERVDGWPAAFTTVLANPPYIRHQKLDPEVRERLTGWVGGIPGVKGRAGLWAYFISHAVALLETGGRMAWVLPGAMMQADYAQPIRDFFARRFERCAAFVVHERLFLEEGTDEETVIVLADGLRTDDREDGRLDVDDATTLEELRALISRWEAGEWQREGRELVPALIGWPPGARALYEALDSRATSLGDMAAISIGLVTGANDFFVLSSAQAGVAGLEEGDLAPVLPKFRAAPGVRFTASDHETYLAGGAKGLLVSSRGRADNSRLAAYLATFDEERLGKISTFRKRASWSEPCDGKIPTAFLPVMHHAGPRLVLNDLGCSSTNTVHRVMFGADVTEVRRKLACVSMLTTFSQLSGEIVGRRYGSGVLKHEPRDAERIRLLMPNLPDDVVLAAFEAVDTALREGDQAHATRIADEIVIGAAAPRALASIPLLASALEGVRIRRRPDRRRAR